MWGRCTSLMVEQEERASRCTLTTAPADADAVAVHDAEDEPLLEGGLTRLRIQHTIRYVADRHDVNSLFASLRLAHCCIDCCCPHRTPIRGHYKVSKLMQKRARSAAPHCALLRSLGRTVIDTTLLHLLCPFHFAIQSTPAAF